MNHSLRVSSIIITMQLPRLFRTSSILLACALAAPLAHATSYEIGDFSSVSVNPGNALEISTSFAPGLNNVAFNLNDGQSHTFGFFNIWTEEDDVGSEDKAQINISATLDFDSPLNQFADFSGVTFGGTYWVPFLQFQYGKVEWNAPVMVTSGGMQFEVSLSDEVFNLGLYGLNDGMKHGATVKATVRQISSNVPDSGSTVALLGLALVSVGVIARRRR